VDDLDGEAKQSQADQELGQVDQRKSYRRAPAHGLAKHERGTQGIGQNDADGVADRVGDFVTHPSQQQQVDRVSDDCVGATQDQEAQEFSRHFPMPLRVLEKSQFADSVIVELLVRKYCDHLPAYRQRVIWERDHGLIVNDALLIRSILKAGELLQPLARAIGEELKKGDLIQADETRVPVLQQEGKGRNDTAWFWQYSAPGGLVYFDYQDSRSRAGPKAFLAGYTRTLQSDGYEVYVNLVAEICAHAGCWAHVRRKFDGARKAAPKEVPCRDSQDILDEVAFLYIVEREARDLGLNADERLRHRTSRGITAKLEALKTKIVSIRSRVLPASQLGKACDYALGQWEKLMVYTRDGRVEIDNNWCENAMRPIAVGRKNWMHLGSQESGPKVAAIMTVIASAQRHGINVRDYLSFVLPRLADPEFKTGSLPDLLPTRWRPEKK